VSTRITILKHMSRKDGPVTKADLIDLTDKAEGTVRNALAQLTSNGWAVENNSEYRITPAGLEALESKAAFRFRDAPKIKPREAIIDQIFDWDSIQTSNACRGVLDSKVEDAPWIDLLAPIVIVYLKAKGIEFPAITLAVAENSNDETLEMIYDDFVNKLMDNIA